MRGSEPSSLLTPATDAIPASELAVAKPGSMSASHLPRGEVGTSVLWTPIDAACGGTDAASVGTTVSFGAFTTGGRGGVKRTASLLRLKKPLTRALTTRLMGLVTLSKAAAVPSEFSMPCVTRSPLFVMFIVLV